MPKNLSETMEPLELGWPCLVHVAQIHAEFFKHPQTEKCSGWLVVLLHPLRLRDERHPAPAERYPERSPT